jgi:AdoMet-dependent heme synthase
MNLFAKRLKDLSLMAKYRMNTLSCETLFINLTSKCNSKCIFCEAHCLDASRDMDSLDIHRVVEESKALDIRTVYLSGGEPFLSKDIWDVIRKLSVQDQACVILTNGLLVERFDQDQLDTLKQASWLDVSLEAAEPDIHDQLRGRKGFFEKTVRGIEILKKNGNEVNLNSIICSRNFDELRDLIGMAKEIGASTINFQPVHIWSNYHDVEHMDKSYLTLTEDQIYALDAYLEDLVSFSRSIDMHTSLPHVKPWLKKYFEHQKYKDSYLWMRDVVNNFSCIEVFTKAFVDADGSVLPCALLKPCASIKEMSLKEALKKYDQIKKSILKGCFPTECHKCSCQMAINYTFSLKNSPIRNCGEIFRLMRENYLSKSFSEK